MSEEAQEAVVETVQEAVTTAPETTTTADVVESPVEGEGDKPEAKPKTFTQEDVDRIVSKEKARVERKIQRDIQREIDQRIEERLKAQTPEKVEEPSKPRPDQFQTTEEYVEAVAEWKADELLKKRIEVAQREHQERARAQHHEQVLTTFKEREHAAKAKYEDFEEVAYDPSLPITPAMAQVIQESDLGPEVAYFLGKNPKDAERISRLSPFLQAKELGRIEDKIASTPAAPKPSKAPEPISPISRPAPVRDYVDTTDPKSLEKLGTSAWIEAERQRQQREWEKRRR